MRKFLLLAILTLVAACTVENEPESSGIVYPSVVSARIDEETAIPETKVYADANLKVLWDNDDRISLFNKYTYNKEYRFSGRTGANSGTFKEVSTGDVVVGNELDNVYAVYPYQELTEISNSGVLTLDLPAEQTYRENSFGRGANTMVSATTNTELLFKNLCGYLVLKLYGDDVAVSSISIKGNNHEVLAGTADVTVEVGSVPSLSFWSTGTSEELTLTCETPVALGATAAEATVFWLVVPPQTFTNGFTLTVTDPDGNTFEQSANMNMEIKRNKTFRMGALEVELDSQGGVDPEYPDYLYFTGQVDGSSVALSNSGSNNPNVEYSFDRETWMVWNYSAIPLCEGETVYMRGSNGSGFSSSVRKYSTFKIVGRVAAGGNVMSLIFYDDLSSKTIPGQYCFSRLFKSCSGLTAAPELPATTLMRFCYSYMFEDCSGLTTVPELPATALIGYCYTFMFSGCTGLTTAPELPATILAEACYSCMFSGCTGLTSAPELPALTLAEHCYGNMFSGCTRLTTAPDLPALTLAEHCYSGMFSGCTGLTSAPELPAPTLAESCYSSMFYECSSLLVAPELPATTLAESCYYAMFYRCSGLTSAPELPAQTLAESCYGSMFYECTNLSVAPELPGTTLAESCYSYMFSGCTGLTSAPKLSAQTLAESCYRSMFSECTNLSVAPELPGRIMASNCYNRMFWGCTGLTTAPELPAPTLAEYCYDCMFSGCTGLISAPDLPATTLAVGCYRDMFIRCTGLKYIKMMATDVSADSCMSNWVSGVPSGGRFVKNSTATWDIVGVSGVPSGWTVETAEI